MILFKKGKLVVQPPIVVVPPVEPEVPVGDRVYPVDNTFTTAYSVASLPYPGYLVEQTETSYPTGKRTYWKRITGPGAPSAVGTNIHHYSKTAVWNCNMTRCTFGGNLFHPQTLAYLQVLPGGSLGSNPQWSQVDPNTIYGLVSGSGIFRKTVLSTNPTTGVVSGVTTTVFQLANCTRLSWESEGTMDSQSRYSVFHAIVSGVDRLVVYDLQIGQIITNRTLSSVLTTGGTLDFPTMTQSGLIMLRVSGTSDNKQHKIYDRDLNFVRALHNGSHPDFGYDAFGNEVMCTTSNIGYSKVATGEYTLIFDQDYIEARNITSGGHCSMRINTNYYPDMKGWAYISLTNGKREYLAVKLNGQSFDNATVRRFGFVRDVGEVYADEGQGIVSSDGTKVIVTSKFSGQTQADDVLMYAK